MLSAIVNLTACAPSSSWWANHPAAFRVSAAYQTSELLYDTPRSPDATPKSLRIPIIIENDGRTWMRFAAYSSENRGWVGDGATISIRVSPQPKIRKVDIDYSSLSKRVILPGGESAAAWIVIQPDSSLLTPGLLKKVKLDVEIEWKWQDRRGEALPLTRSARFYPDLICIGEISPRKATATGE